MKPYCVIAVRGGWKWIMKEFDTYSEAYNFTRISQKDKRLKLLILAQVQGKINL